MEEPNTTLFFDKKIARVIFDSDFERKIYWMETFVSIQYHHLHHLHLVHHHSRFLGKFLPIQEWIESNNLMYPFDENGRVLFELTWS